MNLRIAFLVAALSVSIAQAQPPGGPPAELDKAEPRAAPEERLLATSTRLLAEARRLREGEGCTSALPTYRVVAGMGEGEEAAQHELGECLLTVTGATPLETELFRQEGVFWLTRAAHAGNARAQRALAVHFAPQSMGAAANAEALKWALVYAKNPDANVYGYKELPATFVPGLSTALGPDAAAKAKAFADSFKPLTLAKFTPPKAKKGAERPGRPPQGEGRPRP